MTRALVRRRSRRPGFALLSVLVAMTLLAVFAVGAAFLAVLETRGLRSASRQPAVQIAAESLAVGTVAAWPGAGAARLTVGDSVVSLARTNALESRVRVLRLSSSRYLVTAAAEDPRFGVRGGVWLAVRRDSLPELPPRALTAPGAPDVRGRAVVDDADRAPALWDGCPEPPPNDSASSPADAARRDTLAEPAFGGVPWDTLAAHADVRVEPSTVAEPAPVTVGARCVASGTPDLSWGEPRRAAPSACAAYYPVIAASGDLTLRGEARGQGVLIVGGDLVMRDDAYFAGVVLVRGRALLLGGARVVGALVVRDVRGLGSVIADGARVQRSTCALGRATAGAAPVRVDGAHAWAPLW